MRIVAILIAALLLATPAVAVRLDGRTNSEDVHVELNTGINWTAIGPSKTYTNPWEQLQDAVNPYLTGTGATPWVVRISGSASADLSDLRQFRYHDGTSDTTFPMDAGLVIAPASSIHSSGMPIIDGQITASRGAALTLIYDGVRIEQEMNGQTRPAASPSRGTTSRSSASTGHPRAGPARSASGPISATCASTA